MTSPPPSQQPPIPRRRWRIAWLLSAGVLVNYFDRVNLSVSHAALFTAFGISDIAFGYLSGAYNWTYALCQLPIGVVLDRFGVRRVGRISAFLWSVASFAAALAPSVPALFGARLLLGVGEAPTFPANAKAIGQWFPPQERAFATALSDSAAKFASALGVPVLGIVLLTLGWRWSFALTGLLSLAYFAAFTRFYRDPAQDPHLTQVERQHIQSQAEEQIWVPHSSQSHRDEWVGPEPLISPSSQSLPDDPAPAPAPLSYLLRRRKVLGLALGFGAYNYTFYLLLTWLPSYLSQALGIDLLHSFLYTGVPWLFATFTDLASGYLADTLIQRGYNPNRVRKTILVFGMICGLGILGAADAHTPLRALLWISCSLGGLAAAAPVGWSIPSLIAPRGSTGTVGGIINFFSQLSAITAPVITGYLVHATHNFYWAFAVGAIYLLLGIAGYLFLLGKIEPVPPPLTA